MSFLKKGKKQSMRKKGELPNWFVKNLWYLRKKEGGEVENPLNPSNKIGEKFYLNKEELSMYEFIMWVQWDFRTNQWCYSDEEKVKINDWFVLGLRWFRTTNPKMYMRLLD